MRISSSFLLLGILIMPDSALTQEQDQAPVAKKVPTALAMHGTVRQDDYFWLRERDNPEVIKYLTAENDYLKSRLAPM